ncbi:MAG: HAD-IIIA family hydrolase [Rubritepida sp.]|nr:HAD-IIIA family hydrolase [Rubritepida sp.]
MSPRRAIFLDRDGVLNAAMRDPDGRPLPPRSAAQLAILPGVPEACAALRRAGFLLIGCTNQPDIARGTTPRAFIDWVNAQVVAAAGLDEMRLCPHDDADRCRCRKPLPGMLLDAAATHGIDLGASWMVGDRFRDVEAGQAAGCRTLFIDCGYAERPPALPPTATAASLRAGLHHILPCEECLP